MKDSGILPKTHFGRPPHHTRIPTYMRLLESTTRHSRIANWKALVVQLQGYERFFYDLQNHAISFQVDINVCEIYKCRVAGGVRERERELDISFFFCDLQNHAISFQVDINGEEERRKEILEREREREREE